MGWLDYHLHEFRVNDWMEDKIVKFGIPGDDFDDHYQIEPSWESSIYEYFVDPGDSGAYIYDFGDNWVHEILLEGIFLAEKGVKYPKCVAGERACPPEDCGGVGGYARLLGILDDPADEEHEDMVSWLQGHAKNYYPFDPAEFNPEAVGFSNPKKRFEEAFSEVE